MLRSRSRRLKPVLFDEPQRQGVTVVRAIRSLDSGNDGEHDFQNTQRQQERNPNEYKGQYEGDHEGDEHGDLKIDGLLALVVDKGMLFFLDEPYDERPEEEADPVAEKSHEGTQMTEHCPIPDVLRKACGRFCLGRHHYLR